MTNKTPRTFALLNGCLAVASGEQRLHIDPQTIRAVTTAPSLHVQGHWSDGDSFVMFEGGSIRIDGVSANRMAYAWRTALCMVALGETCSNIEEALNHEPPSPPDTGAAPGLIITP